MGFFDEYKEIGGSYVNADEKQVLMDNGIPVQVVAVQEDNESQYGARYVATVLIPDPENGGEERKLISFNKQSVESRDRMLVQMMAYLEREDADPVMVKLEKVGKAILLRSA